MKSVVFLMASATKSMHLPSLMVTMDKFEKMIDNLGGRQAYMNEALDNVSKDTYTDQVNHLMARMIDRAGLDVKHEMPGVESLLTSSTPLTQSTPSPLTDTELDEKLAKLRNDYQR